jgi:DNA repair protein RecN (Recombination protein N)
MEFLRHEIGEIDAAGLQPGEEEELRNRLNRIIHAEKLRGLSESAYAALYEGESPSAVDLLDRALSGIAELGGISAEFLELSAPLQEARAQVEAVAETLRGNLSDTEYDPAELDTLHRRQNIINDLKRKYGADIAEILAYRDRAAAELAGYDSRDARLAELREQEARLRGEATEAAQALSAVRRKAAAVLDRKIAETLRDLDMKGARFETRFTDIPLCAHGVDGVEFLLSANAGEKPKPLRAVASGGEMSRIMLALKSVFAGMDRIPTLVFDEIDAGVGGVVARRVAEKMAALAESHQVLCISHLPQIAAAADAHYVVEKQVRKGVTATAVARVDGEARERELARLLDGSLSDVSLEHARALLRDMGSTK